MKRVFAGSLGVALALWSAAPADDTGWRPIIARTAEQAAEPPPRVTLGRPVVSLGRPLPMAGATAATTGPVADAQVAPVAYHSAGNPSTTVVRMQTADPPPPSPPPTFGQVPSPVAPPPPPPPVYGVAPPPPPGDAYNWGVVTDPVPGTPPESGDFWGKTKDVLSIGGRCKIESDRCFPVMVSPITNPFLFEDPRSLTEVRPIFIYQTIPKSNYLAQGGQIEFFGLQARLALGEKFSFVINKLGGINNDPSQATPQFDSGSGFAEVMLGPKFTFLRNESSGTVAAVGLTFDIPVGSATVYQNTGSLSLIPYVSAGTNFWRSSYGTFNVLGNFGWSLSTDSQRSDFVNLSGQLSYDVANLHRIYPLVALSWFYWTKSGTASNLGFEGGDLINFGSENVQGNNNFSIAAGARFKLSDCWSFGTAAEWSLGGRQDLMDFRLTFDMILRY